MAGEITNGGLVAIRSKASPATGAKNEPSRTSMLVAPLRSALIRAIQRARALTSVATTSRLCPARCSAWTPQPVPRSSDRPTGSRMVSRASDDDAELMPRTWSAPTRLGAPSRPGVRSLTTQRSVSSSEYGRQSRRAATSPTLRSSRPSAQSASTRLGERRLGGGQRHRVLEQEEPGQRLDRRPPAGTAQAGHRLVAREGGVRLGAERGRHPVVRVVRGLERVAQPAGHVAVHTPTPTGRRW